MRHRKDHRKLSRTREHRKALLRNLATSLVEHERIETTVAKAKEARRLAERMITFAKKGDIASRRHVARFIHGDHNVRKLFDTIAPWYAERNGGYTRILKIGRRLGDAGEMALLELVKTQELKDKLRAEAGEKAKAAKEAAKAAGVVKGAKKDAATAKKAAGAAAKAAAKGEPKAEAGAEGAAAEAPAKEKGGAKGAKAGRGEKTWKRSTKGAKGPGGKGGGGRVRHQGRSGD
jgi:large subunit ribosomal protein L17